VAKVVSGGYITDAGPIVYRVDHQIRFTGRQQAEIEKLLELFRNSPFSPPSVKECQAMVGNDVFSALIDLDILIAVSKEVVFQREDYQRMISELEKLFAARQSLTAAEVRDHFKTSRKYTLSLLEHLDSTGMTVREGDSRRLRNQHK
jgi:selenocysteine-specific elongation factor